jgi:hypothetical protein
MEGTIKQTVELLLDAGYDLTIRDGELEATYRGHAEPSEQLVGKIEELKKIDSKDLAQHIQEATQVSSRPFEYDPRPEFNDDHQLWEYVLKEAFPDGEASKDHPYYRLHIMRCMGAKLAVKEEGIKLTPRIVADGSTETKWSSPKEFEEDYEEHILFIEQQVQEIFECVRQQMEYVG